MCENRTIDKHEGVASGSSPDGYRSGNADRLIRVTNTDSAPQWSCRESAFRSCYRHRFQMMVQHGTAFDPVFFVFARRGRESRGKAEGATKSQS
jgi:hypothetical protein